MRVKILNFNGKPDVLGDVIDPAGVLIREGRVPVTYDYSADPDRSVGWATLEKTEDGVYANIHVSKEMEEILKGLYPGAGGVVINRQTDVDADLAEREPGVSVIKRCEIWSVGVQLNRNVDRDIETIGAQVSLYS